MLIVDSNGVGLKIRGAKKLHGVGLFWGYNIFLNQRIKVQPIIAGKPFEVSLSEVKELVLKSFRNWHGWEARGDFEELRAAVAKAGSIQEMICRLSER
jgi:hypothetical protein